MHTLKSKNLYYVKPFGIRGRWKPFCFFRTGSQARASIDL
ncbi:hypothetical protein CCP2SC5_560013 [Azospirillaceae bacterium]